MKRFIYISLLSLSLTGIVTSCDLDAPAQSAMEEPKIVMQDIEDFVLDESLSTHDKIRKLYSNGYNDVEIAKRLNMDRIPILNG